MLIIYSSQVQDMYKCRIIAFLKTMAETLLLNLPPGDTLTIEYFLSHSKVSQHKQLIVICDHFLVVQTQCRAGLEVLKASSKKVEEAVKDLIGRLRHTAMLPKVLPSDSEGTVKAKSG